MRKLITIVLALTPVLCIPLAHSKSNSTNTFYYQGKTINRYEAAKVLLTNPGASVLSCHPMELSGELRLRKRKDKGSVDL